MFEKRGNMENRKVGSIVIEEMIHNLDHRKYHLRTVVSGVGEAFHLERGKKDIFNSPIPQIFITFLDKIPGVTDVSCFHFYDLGVTRGPAFSWDEIEEALLPILFEYQGEEPPRVNPFNFLTRTFQWVRKLFSSSPIQTDESEDLTNDDLFEREDY
jgi:hypothetical protein